MINKGEIQFQILMEKKGYELISQPYLKQFRMRPDFYCLQNKTYYEVITTRQSYHFRKDKIKKAQESGFKIKVVNPDGTPYHSKKILNLNNALFCKRPKCGHSWIPRKEKVWLCPKCHSPRWNEY